MGALTNPPQRLSAEATLAMLRDRQQQLGAMLLKVISFVADPELAGTPRSKSPDTSGVVKK